MKFSEKTKNRIENVKEFGRKALPYAIGVVGGTAVMVLSYKGASWGAQKALGDVTYEFYFKTKEGEAVRLDEE